MDFPYSTKPPYHKKQIHSDSCA
uniref:Uncharacterized protein n=1 Tax=Anguilla anguilla TaxID=7936 RepID=A0A0E9VPN3_ANGAN